MLLITFITTKQLSLLLLFFPNQLQSTLKALFIYSLLLKKRRFCVTGPLKWPEIVAHAEQEGWDCHGPELLPRTEQGPHLPDWFDGEEEVA